jgi:pyruvate dehydrogenase E2 component (dihydrolipoamide acetyltransferase)
MAKARNIPLSAVTGSGPAGRIIKRDLETYGVPGAAPRTFPTTQVPSEIPLTSMRRLIARRLSESFFTAPHFFVTVEIDMEAAATLRSQLERAEGAKVSYNDLLIKACARALADFPLVNARWAEDRILTFPEIHIGMAVALPDGLITPVIRHANRKGLIEIAREAKELAARSRDRKLLPDEYTGSTFTISNLGMFGVTAFTAIINPPESAILAVGAARRVPVVDGETIRPGLRMNVTLSCDHRVVDGVLAARFLDRIRVLLEAPASLLLG